jgi:hypothetical protein
VNTQLSSALKTVADLTAELAPIDRRIAKLTTLTQAVSPAQSERAALTSAQAHAVKAWVANAVDDEPAPVLDAAVLDRLDSEIRAHDASKASANEGIRALSAARNEIIEKLRAAEHAAHYHAVESIVAEAAPEIFAEVSATLQAYVDASSKFESLRAWLLDKAHVLKDAGLGNGLFSVTERLHADAAKLSKPPTIIDYAPFAARLHETLTPNAEEVA